MHLERVRLAWEQLVQRLMVEPKLAETVVGSLMGSWVQPWVVRRLVEHKRMAWEPRSLMEPRKRKNILAP